MIIPVKAYGFDVDALVVTARGVTVGTQRANFNAAVSTAIGANPILQIDVDGVVKYKATITGSLGSSAAGVALPETTNAPTVNVADPLTSENCFLRVINATDVTKYLKVPIIKGPYLGSSAKWTVTEALTGSAQLKLSAVINLAPPVLDFVAGSTVTPSSGVNASATITLNDMSQDNDVLAVPANGNALGLRKAQVYVPSYDALVDMCLNNRGTLPTFVNAVVPLLHVWEAATNTAVNATVAVRRVECLILRKSTSTWARIGGPSRLWGYITAALSGNGSVGNLEYDDDGESTLLLPEDNAYELHPEAFFSFRNRTLITDAAIFHVRAQARLVVTDPSLADDRANARFYANQGFDLYAINNTTNERPPNFFPNRAVFGGNSRSKMIAYDGTSLSNGTWTTFSFTSTASFGTVMTPAPWGNGTTAWAYDSSPWITGDTPFNNNLPPLP